MSIYNCKDKGKIPRFGGLRKMFDEKGRLFGKINIIDLLVIVLIVIVAVVLAVKFLGPGNGLSAGQGVTVTYTVEVDGVKPEVYENIQQYIPGDKLMASGEILDGRILAVTAEPHTLNASITTQDGALIVPLDAGLLDLTFTIESKVSNTITSEVGTQEVRVGKTHIVKSVHVELPNGIITSCDWNPDKYAVQPAA